LTLGAVDMSPFDVASIYQTFAANGFHSELRSVTSVLDNKGKPLQRYQLDLRREMDPSAVSIINFALHHVTLSGTAKRLSSELEIDVAGKTGTSDSLNDSWFAGFSGDHIAVVWLGYDDHRSTGLTGSSGAMKVWSRLFQSISTRSIQQDFPDNVELYWIDRGTGLRSNEGCENAVELPFISGSQPEDYSGCKSGSPLDWIKNIFD